MNETVLGIDLNGVCDHWTSVKTFESPVYRYGSAIAPAVVVAPLLRGEKPLAGRPALESITGKGWLWPDDAHGPDENGFSRRIPVLELFKLLNEGKKEIEYCKESFFSVSELIASHLSALISKRAASSVLAIPDHADESFRQMIINAGDSAGRDKPRLIWRPVAILLKWGASLSEDYLHNTHGSDALVVYLGPLGFECSIMRLEIEKSRFGNLLTPVRSSAGKCLMDGQFSINDLASRLSRHYSRLTGDTFLAWQMLWGTPFVWRKLLGQKSLKTLFQNSDGRFIELLAPEIEIQDTLLEEILDGLRNLLGEFDAAQLSRVKHVLIGGHFLQLPGDRGLTLGNRVRDIIKRRVGVNALFHDGVTSIETGEDPVAKGAAIYAWRLAHDLPTYYDFLPQLEINAISDGEPDFIPLIPKQAKIKGGESYKHKVTQPFSIPPGVPHLEFYIHKEGDQVRKTITKLKDPPRRETPVQLMVQQTPGQGHAEVEIHPDTPGIFGPRTLRLDWDSLDPTYKDKTDILEKLSAEAGVCYPHHTPVLTHEKVWGQKSTVDLMARYLITPHLGSTKDHEAICIRLKGVLSSKKRGSSLRLKKLKDDIFSIVSSDGEAPDDAVRFRDWKTDFIFNGPARNLLSLVLEKISSEFSFFENPKQICFDREQKLQLLFLVATWCYSGCPSNVVEYLLDQLEKDFVKSGIQAEAASRCVSLDDQITRFFAAAEKHCDASGFNQKWTKAITQVFQFRENSPKLLSETQALKFTLMALGIIVSETEQNNFRIKFLWGVLLLTLIFRYRIKNRDFLRWDRPQYESAHKIIKYILEQTLHKVERVNRHRHRQLKDIIDMLDYKGTNQLIAREVASELAGSNIDSDVEDKASTHTVESVELRDYNGDIRQALVELERLIRPESPSNTIQMKPFPEPKPQSSNYSREYKPAPKLNSSYKPSKPKNTSIRNIFGFRQASSSSSSPSVPWEVPSAAKMEIHLLKLINQDHVDVELFDVIPKIAAKFNIPITEFRDRNSGVYKRLSENLNDAAYNLFATGLIKLSESQKWRITVEGLYKLRSVGLI